MENVKVRAPIRVLLIIVSIPFWIGFALALAPLWFGEPIEFDVTLPLFLIMPFVFSWIAISGRVPKFD